jgi:hypothetical protein
MLQAIGDYAVKNLGPTNPKIQEFEKHKGILQKCRQYSFYILS